MRYEERESTFVIHQRLRERIATRHEIADTERDEYTFVLCGGASDNPRIGGAR